MSSGIYIIRNSVNGKVYVGSAKVFKSRFRRHLADLRKGDHHSPMMQRFAAKYGIETLRFELLATCQPAELLAYEQRFLDAYQCYHAKHGFNTCRVAGSALGVKHTEETKAKRKIAMNRPEVRAQLTASKTGKRHTPETKAKLALINTGRKHSPETRAKMLANRTPEVRAKASVANKGKVVSAETRAKLSAASKGRRHTPESKAKLSARALARFAK